MRVASRKHILHYSWSSYGITDNNLSKLWDDIAWPPHNLCLGILLILYLPILAYKLGDVSF